MAADLISTLKAADNEGRELLDRIDAHLLSLPRTADGLVRDDLSIQHRETCDVLRDRVCHWFAIVATQARPHTAFEPRDVAVLMHTVTAAVWSRRFYSEYRPTAGEPSNHDMSPEFNVERPVRIEIARAAVKNAMTEALQIVKAALAALGAESEQTAGNPTAFLLMWMDAARPELVDVHQAVKEVFKEFGVDAFRADEVEHQDRITELVLERIRTADFLFADLTGERPNVYYEVGFAHALGKRPILYRRAGTSLHFDLAVHNVPEYANITSLRSLLRQRLGKMLVQSKVPMQKVQRTQAQLAQFARERVRASAIEVVPDLVGQFDLSSLVLSSEGFYEITVAQPRLFRKLRKVINQIEQHANLGFISLRCPPMEERIQLRQKRRKLA